MNNSSDSNSKPSNDINNENNDSSSSRNRRVLHRVPRSLQQGRPGGLAEVVVGFCPVGLSYIYIYIYIYV